MSDEQLISDIESLIRRDPARRGLIGTDGNGPGEGELAAASRLFCEHVSGACLLTGFFIPTTKSNDSPDNTCDQLTGKPTGHAETDGPPGTIMLADVLTRLGVPVTILTDELCLPVIQAACSIGMKDHARILSSPVAPRAAAEWRTQTLKSDAIQTTSHLVAIERVGPGYTTASLLRNETSSSVMDQILDPASLQGQCCNMRGENISRHSADLHLLYDAVRSQKPNVHTVGVGDGGNEIGMGRFRWSDLRSRIPGPNADRIPCRIAADRTIVAGISNWGAYALAAAIAVQLDRIDLLERHTAHAQQCVLEHIVFEAGAVDGVTRRNEPTVDGLPFLTQIQPWIAIRKRLGLKP